MINAIYPHSEYIKSKLINTDLSMLVEACENYNEGLNKEKNKEFESAVNSYEMAAKCDPFNALYPLRIATVYNHQKKNNEAKLEAEIAIKYKLVASYDALAAINIHSAFFAERHEMAEFIVKYRNVIRAQVEQVSNKPSKSPGKIKVFVYWDKSETMPAIVKACRENLKKYIEPEFFDLIELNADNLSEYLDVPNYLHKNLRHHAAWFSDWIRVKLLQKYGGLWIDSTCYLTDYLHKNLGSIMEQDTFLFTYAGSRTGNWFFWSKSNSYILNMVIAAFELWWQLEERATNYFMFHDIVEMMYWVDEKYNSEWNKSLKIHPRNALSLLNKLAFTYSETEFNSIIKGSFIHKLTYKVSIGEPGGSSYFSHILKLRN